MLIKRTARQVILLLVCMILLFSLVAKPVKATNATAYTYTLSADMEWIRTQDAYLVEEVLFQDYKLSSASDIYVRGNIMYIADTGNSRIVVRNLTTDQITTFGEDVLSAPTGVFHAMNDKIYVADTDKVYQFDTKGNLLREYGRPQSITFGANGIYKPTKVAADKAGTLYITSDGTFEGIIQLAENGDFLGYFGYNFLALSPIEVLQELFFSEEQKARLFNKVPYTFSNVSLSDKGLIYSLTSGTFMYSLKKHNISGINMLEKNQMTGYERNFVDLSVGRYGQMYAVTEAGLIYEYDSDGNILFTFGGLAITAERNGLLTVASGIASDENDTVYVLDKERGNVHVFAPTQFSIMLHQAIDLYDKGEYEQSRDLWLRILRESGSSKMVHRGLGNCYLQLKDFEQSEYHYKLAKDIGGYSESYWEIRDSWMMNNTGIIIGIVVAFILVLSILKFLDKKYRIYDPLRKAAARFKRFRFINDILFVKRFIVNPADGFYDVRHDLNGSARVATIFYLITFLITIWSLVGRGFILTPVSLEKINLLFLFQLFFIPLGLFIVCNYMVSAINDGESRFKDVYIFGGYAFAPIILFMPIVNLISYVVTINEVFLVTFPSLILVVWTGILFLVGLKQINDYEFGDVIKNVLLTIFFMCIVLLVFTMIQMFWDKIFELIYAVTKEVVYRVSN